MSIVLPALPTSKFAWKSQLITFDVSPPTLNTLHEVFHKTGGVIVHSLNVRQDNTPTNAEEIDVLITIDGRTILFDSSAINPLGNAGSYHFDIDIWDPTMLTETSQIAEGLNATPIYQYEGTAPYRGQSMKGHDIKVEVRQTSAIAAGARIRASLVIEVLEAI